MRWLVAVSMLTASCATGHPAQRSAFIAEVDQNILSFDGKTVELIGWVHECKGNSCSLEDASNPDASLHMLSFAYDPKLDAQLARRLGQKLHVRATIDARCQTDQVMCIDRLPELNNVEVLN